MRNYCKLLRSDLTAHGGFAWVPGQWIKPEKDGPCKPCSPTALHAYTSPALAAFLNPIHAAIIGPVCYALEFENGHVGTDGLKVWGATARITETLPLPKPTKRQCVVFAVLATRLVLARGTIPAWDAWADAVLAGDGAARRATEAARAARRATEAARAADAAARAAARAAAWAAWAADAAADAAARAAARAAAEQDKDAFLARIAEVAEQALTY